MTDLMKYVEVVDNVVSKEFCEHITHKFHSNQDLWIKRDDRHANANGSLFVKRFNELNFTTHSDEFEKEMEVLHKAYDNCIQLYKSKFPDWQFPRHYRIKDIRMKHYPAGEGEFRAHVDASHWNTMSRFLVFFLYLDEGPGGQTLLFDQATMVERKPGRMLMFPPTWTYPHSGIMPKEVDKHIIGGYLHHIHPNEVRVDF